MASGGGDCQMQLRGLLVQLDLNGRGKKPDVDNIFRELQTLGARWPEDAKWPESGKAFERLAQQLPKFSESQQQDIVAAFRPLRDDLARRMSEVAKNLNAWLTDSSRTEKASPQRLVELLKSVEAAPHLKCYKQCGDTDTKVRFLWAIACVCRAVQDETAAVGIHVKANAPDAVNLSRRLAQTFFVLSDHGNILTVWHGGRLERYNATLWRAAKRSAEQLKDDLQVRLVSALRAGATPQSSSPAKGRPKVELELRHWPMVGCPLARAFLDFVQQHVSELGDLGHPPLSECPPHSLQPDTLRKMLGRLDAFEIVDSVPAKGGKPSPGLVRLRFEGVQALAYKAVGTKPKASAPGPSPAAPAPPTQGRVSDRSAVDVRPRAVGAEQRARPPGRGAGAGTAAVDTLPRKATVSSGAVASTAGVAAKAAAPKAPAAPKLVRRRIEWTNAPFLRRVVRRGLTKSDEEWTRNWHEFCRKRRIDSELSASNPPPKDAIAEFVEQNITMLLKRDWAKELMYKAEGESDELPPESDSETNVAPVAKASIRSAPVAAGLATGATASAAALGPPQSGIAAAGVGGAAASGALAGASAASTAGSDAASDAAGSSKGADGAGSTAAGAKRSAAAAGAWSDNEKHSSSDSESSSMKKKKKRKKERKMAGMLGYGDYMKGLTPEVMMMNQMMGMSMMMNNPLAMMSMGAMPMTGMPMLTTSSKTAKEKGKKLGRPDEKTRDRDRAEKRERAAEPPRPPPPPPPPAPPAAASSNAKAAMIDADDL